MNLKRFSFCISLLISMVSGGNQAWGQADSFPSKPLRLIVPFAAGGPADVVAREMAISLGRELRQPVLIENMGGGAGVPALNAVSHSSADGHTLLFAASGNVVIQPLLAKKRVDVLTQLSPVALVSTSPHVLVVSGKLPVRTVKEFTDYAKANPGVVNFASAGVGGLAHLASELFIRAAAINANHVPYKGTSQAISDLVTGQVHAMFSSLPSMKGLIDKGELRVLGVTMQSPSPAYKGMPIIKDSGVPGFEYTTWYGIYGPVGLSASVVQKLNQALLKLESDKGLDEKLNIQGVDLNVTNATELGDRTRKESAQWDRVIRNANLDLN